MCLDREDQGIIIYYHGKEEATSTFFKSKDLPKAFWALTNARPTYMKTTFGYYGGYREVIFVSRVI